MWTKMLPGLGVGLFVLGASMSAQAGDDSANCSLHASVDAVIGRVEPSVFVQEIVARCKIGDIVSFPRSHTAVMKGVCDFTKTIVVTSDETICVVSASMRGERP